MDEQPSAGTRTATPVLARVLYLLTGYPFFVLWQSGHATLDLFLLATAIAAPLYILATLVEHKANAPIQTARNTVARQVLEGLRLGWEPVQPFVLYLRPFAITGKQTEPRTTVFDFKRPIDVEELLANALVGGIQLVALGDPGESLGAGRAETSEADWQTVILRAMGYAQAIVLVPGYQHGTLWEMQRVLERGYLAKVIFVVPGILGGSIRNARRDWSKTRDCWKATLDIELPVFDQSGDLFTLGPDKRVAARLGNVRCLTQMSASMALNDHISRLPASPVNADLPEFAFLRGVPAPLRETAMAPLLLALQQAGYQTRFYDAGTRLALSGPGLGTSYFYGSPDCMAEELTRRFPFLRDSATSAPERSV